MVTPAVSVIITRLATREKWDNLYLKPKLKQSIKFYVFAWLGMILLSFVGCVLYFIIFNNSFAPLNSKFSVENNVKSIADYLKLFSTLIPLAIILNPIFGIFFCFGEEFAWRGYLLPKLEENIGMFKSTILTSIIWGVWHTPIIWLGINYNKDKSITAIIAQILLCIVIGGILSYLFFMTKSIWPAVLGHASINAIDKFTPQILFLSADSSTNLLIGPNLVGIIGGAGLIGFAIYIYSKLYVASKNK